MYYKEVDFLPEVPSLFDLSLKEIQEFENVFPHKDYDHTFASYVAPQELADYIQEYFDYPVLTRYQVIRDKVPVHTDLGIVGVKYNYVFESGGNNVRTRFWDMGQIVESVCVQEKVWHSLQIDVPHDVTKVDNARISLTVRHE